MFDCCVFLLICIYFLVKIYFFPLNMVFVDYSKAFDSIHLSAIFKVDRDGNWKERLAVQKGSPNGSLLG